MIPFIKRFWQQENKAYRNMQIVCGLLAIQFLLPSLSYFFTPDLAISQFKAMGRLVSDMEYTVSEESYVWRVLAAGNVFTLSFLCLLLQINIRRFYPVVPAFVVLKGFSSLGYLYVYLFEMRYPVFLGVFIWDGLNLLFVVYFSAKAYRSLEQNPTKDVNLVPPLFFRVKS